MTPRPDDAATRAPGGAAPTPGAPAPTAAAQTPGTPAPSCTGATPGTRAPSGIGATPGTRAPSGIGATPGTRAPAGTGATPGAPAVAAPVLERVAWDHPDAVRLRDAQQAELFARYGEEDLGHDMTGDEIVAMVVLRVGGEAAACGALRDASDVGPATGELKRMFVAPGHRGRGYSRLVLAELERVAGERGWRRLVLETGPLQPEAIALYLSAGYLPVDAYGEYVGETASRCFARELDAPPRTPTADTPRADVVLERVAWTHPDAAALRRAMWVFNQAVYPELLPWMAAQGGYDADDAAQGVGDLATFVARLDGRAVGCASLRAPRAGYPAGSAEMKKVFVDDAARGAGVARALLAAVEDEARTRGYTSLLLQTGIRQPAAVTLYRSLGYRPVAPFGPYTDDTTSLCFGKAL